MSGTIDWFTSARYGLFIHFGLYSLLGRGEWTMNRERIPPDEYARLAEQFGPDKFDAEEIADLAVAGGMRYIIFTTMHHEGFRLYHTELTSYCSTRTAAGRDFTAEIITAVRKRGLKIGLYHSLNNWYDQPDAVAALEDPSAYDTLIKATFARIQELVTAYAPIDILWYDGWWPFNAQQWKAEAMNAMVREIVPHVLFNGRNGLPGDFATPEQHLSAPHPWRPWEGCVTLNQSWGYHAGDQDWKSPGELLRMLIRTAQGNGNLLLNVGPRGDGSIPQESIATIRTVGNWLKGNGDAIYGTELWTIDPYLRGAHRGDWLHYGQFTVKGNVLYLIATQPVPYMSICGLGAKVQALRLLATEESIPYRQDEDRLSFPASEGGGIEGLPHVYAIECDRPPAIYHTGGMRVPACEHPRYDPMPSDIAW